EHRGVDAVVAEVAVGGAAPVGAVVEQLRPLAEDAGQHLPLGEAGKGAGGRRLVADDLDVAAAAIELPVLVLEGSLEALRRPPGEGDAGALLVEGLLIPVQGAVPDIAVAAAIA